ncbi:MAG: aspartyl protease family protein [Acidobacteriota bacterium]
MPFRLLRNHIHFEAEINDGKKVELILDTGMPLPGILLFGDPALSRLGLSSSEKTRSAACGSESSPAKEATGVTLKIGDLLLKDQKVIVSPDSVQSSACAPGQVSRQEDALGVIGYELFSRFLVAIDYDRMLLTFSEPAGFAYQGRGNRIPLTFESNIPTVDIAVRLDGGQSLSLKTVLDLGASHALSLNQESDPGIRLPAKTIESWSRLGGTEIKGRMGRVKALSLGTCFLEHPLVTFTSTRVCPMEKNGNLGNETLRRFNLIFDYSRRELIAEPNSHLREPFEASMSGFQALPLQNGEWIVNHLLPDSPAAEAGLREDDRLTEINGLPGGEMSVDDLYRASTKEGASLTLSVRRGDQRFTVTLKLRPLI